MPHTSDRKSSARISGWSEYVEPLRKKSLVWHKLWCDYNRPHNGIVADCMRRSRALYRYEIRRIRKNEEAIIRDRIADALLNDPRRIASGLKSEK